MQPVQGDAGADGRFTPYQRRLFMFLSVATFFEGYDFLAFTQILPNLRADMHLSEAAGGVLSSVINAGTVAAYLLVRVADRWGRRQVMTITIVGYALTTFASGLAPNVWTFAAAQLVARTFLIGEWAISMVYAAEEYPAARRGLVLGVIQASSSLGSVVCAGVAPLLLKTAYGWRSVYLVGVIPLALIAFARRNLVETHRFREQVAAPTRRPFVYIWSTPYRRRVLHLGAIWAATYACTANAVLFWKEFAVHERHLSDDAVGLSISIAAVAAMPLVFLSGRLIDGMGRRNGGALIFGLGAAGVLGSYTLHGQWPLTVALVFGIFGASAMLVVLNAFTTELFPTELRGDAFAWSNNLIGRVSYVVAPSLVGAAAAGAGWGPAVSVTVVGPIVAIVLVFLLLPETRGRVLEETSLV